MSVPFDLITILGPTAMGKTKLSAQLACRFEGEIISADSRQVYKFMDIGTGKDLADYEVEGRKVPYHLIDIIEPSGEFNLFMYLERFNQSYASVRSRGRLPFMTGGTGLYIDAVLKGYSLVPADLKGERYEELSRKSNDELRDHLLELNSSLHNSTDLRIRERIISAIIIAESGTGKKGSVSAKHKSLTIGVTEERGVIRERITARLKKRLNQGMIEEVESLLERGISFERLELFGLEYKYLALYLKGELNYNDMFQKLNSAIHKFAKRQMTWFRKIEREGEKIHWIKPGDLQTAREIIENNLPGS